MATDPDVDSSRTVVQVYVPAYQRDLWDEHADELEMSRSEFVKTMVQAGRRGFGAETDTPHLQSGDDDGSALLGDEGELKARILGCLEDDGCLSWDQLRTAVTGDVETRLERALQALQNEGKVRHSPREGGYVLDRDNQ
jgi:hypothetical protein